jgi:choice-of-anchor B domain-containing protein
MEPRIFPVILNMSLTLSWQQIWEELDRAGVYDSSQYTSFGKDVDFVPCTNGVASYILGDPKYTFRCSNLDLYDFKTHAELGSSFGRGAGSWGWTSENGREFVAIAQLDGTAFAEVNAKGKLVYLGRLPQYTTANTSLWREIKGYKSYVVIGSEAEQHGIQIFDLKKLVTVDPTKPVLFSNEKDLDGFWTEGLPLGRSHNVVVNEEGNYGLATGFAPRNGTLGAGLVFFDLSDPTNPKTLGGTGEDGYVHDAQCMVYRGPDQKYYGREVCYGYDEDSVAM